MSKLIQVEIQHDSLPFSVVFDDDGKVGYAYLLNHDSIVGDVWLFNHGPAPASPEWRDRDKAPFANPRGFAVDSAIVPENIAQDIEVSWIIHEGILQRVEVHFKDILFAVLAPGQYPGWCRNALKDGPLAKALTDNLHLLGSG